MKTPTLIVQLVLIVGLSSCIATERAESANAYSRNRAIAEKPCKKRVMFGPKIGRGRYSTLGGY